MANQRKEVTREFDGRTSHERPKTWQPASRLPEPDKQPGYAYKWIRISIQNNPDANNLSAKLREGWEPVKIEEQRRMHLLPVQNSQFEGCVEVGGLLLCKIPEELMTQRREYFSGKNRSQMESVDNNFMRENDQRMPLINEKRTTVSFGKGK
jgi:hypothetical protein